MKKILVLCLFIIFLVACQNEAVPETDSSNESLENSSIDSQVVQAIEENSNDQNSIDTQEDKTYYFFPNDMSPYEGKTILHFGYLYYFEFNVDNFPIDENIWIQWNDYLVEHDSPYVVQMVACRNDDAIYDETMLLEAEKELGYTFDLVAYLDYRFTSQDMENCMEDLTEELNGALEPLYTSLPEKYWSLISENGHIYNLANECINNFYQLSISSNFEKKINSIIESAEDIKNISDYFAICVDKIAPPKGSAMAFEQNGMKTLPFFDWKTDAYFAMIAPMVGIDFLSDSDEIICLLDSPTFTEITQLYISCTMEKLNPQSVFLDNRVWVASSTFSFALDQVSHYNIPYYAGHQNVSVRKDSIHKEEVYDFILQITTNQEAAQFYYLGDPSLYQKTSENVFVQSDIIHLFNGPQLLNYFSLLPTDKGGYEFLDDTLEKAKGTPLTGFRFDIEPVYSEINALQEYFKTSEPLKILEDSLQWQNYDISELLKQMRTEMDEVGLQTVIEEAKRQYEIWKEEEK